jgi:hypothetical protein
VKLCVAVAVATVFVGSAGVASVGTTMARSGSVRGFDVTATGACLRSSPGAVSTLPTALPPDPQVLFVYRYPRDRSFGVGQLGAWTGRRETGTYHGVNVVFFGEAARRWVAGQSGVTVVKNAAFQWFPASSKEEDWGANVRSCLRVAGFKSGAKRAAPRANRASFTGYWGGHTRGLRIGSDGRGREYVDAGCCIRDYEMTFRILSVTGTLGRANALYRVSWIRQRIGLSIHVGDRGTLRLRNGIVTNALTSAYFCSDPAWLATAACGA